MGFSLRWGGILLGAIALFSLAHERYAFTLAPVMQEALDHYRSSLHPFAEPLSHRLNRGLDVASLTRPGMAADLIVLYLVHSILLLWFYIFDDFEWHQSGEERVTLPSLLGRFTIALFWPLLLPAAAYLVAYAEEQGSLKSWGLAIAKVFALVVILCGANACASTLS